MKFKLFAAAMCLSMLCAAATVSAADTTSSITVQDKAAGADYGVMGASDAKAQKKMLAVNPQDTIKIIVSGAGDNLTLLSYKVGEDPGSDTIQYVNQYAATDKVDGNVDGNYEINYVVRDLAYGVYYLKINNGKNEGVETVYYKVGAPTVNKGEDTKTTYYKKVSFGATGDIKGSGKETTSVAYLSKITPKDGYINEYGYNIVYGEKSQSYFNTVSTDSTINGDLEFGITVYGFETASFEEEVKKLTVTPYVNYSNVDDTTTTVPEEAAE